MPTTTNSGDDLGADALLTATRLAAAFKDLGRMSHEVRCQASELLDSQSGSVPYSPEALVRLLGRLDAWATALNRAVHGYAEQHADDVQVPELEAAFKANGWEEQNLWVTDGFCETPPGGKLGDRARGYRRTFDRADQRLVVFFTGPDVVFPYAWTGTRWVDIDGLHEVVTAEPVNNAAIVAKLMATNAREARKPLPLTVDEVIERAQAARWSIVRDMPCTAWGATGLFGLPEGADAPGRSVTLRCPDGRRDVTAWGLPGEPAGVRSWVGPVRTVEQLDQVLGTSAA